LKIFRFATAILLAFFANTGCYSNSNKKSGLLSIPRPLVSWQKNAELAEANPQPYSRQQVVDCQTAISLPDELPKPAHPTNFGERKEFSEDGKKLPNKPSLVVIHETVLDETSTVSLFGTPHHSDSQQVSYHVLVARDGSLLRIVPDKNRAYGAGKSHFGGYTIRSSSNSPGSINNVALHISLVSPPSSDTADSHSGYTNAQYRTLAGQVLKWQLSYGIPLTSVTTHEVVDRSHSRYDPRSFKWHKFDSFHSSFASKCGASIVAITSD